MAQTVERQHLVGFGQAHFPWNTSVLDGALRARTSTAIMAGNQDHVGLGLGDTGGNGADAGTRDQFHTDAGVRVDLFQIINQLGQILDRINIVVRWRADQSHSLCRMAKLGNHR